MGISSLANGKQPFRPERKVQKTKRFRGDSRHCHLMPPFQRNPLYKEENRWRGIKKRKRKKKSPIDTVQMHFSPPSAGLWQKWMICINSPGFLSTVSYISSNSKGREEWEKERDTFWGRQAAALDSCQVTNSARRREQLLFLLTLCFGFSRAEPKTKVPFSLIRCDMLALLR